jgi:cytochrome P450
MSLLDSAREELQIPHTMGSPIHDNPYHLHILRQKLTRRLDMLIEKTMDEIAPAFEDGLQTREPSEWTSFRTQNTFEQIVARVFNRILVGVPTCRDRRYLDLSLQFTVNTVLTSFTLNLLPKFLKPLVGPLISSLPRTKRLAMEYLGPLIEERKRLQAEDANNSDDWQDKPEDILSWLMNEAEGPEQETAALAVRILVVNSATIHTSSMTFTQAIFNLATRPEYIEPLRQEAEEALQLYGWNKLGMSELPKMDSFFKESIRLNGLGSIGFPRITMQDYTFSDGTSIPSGSYVSAALSATHLDEAYYKNAKSFDGYRHLGKSGGKHGMSVTSSRYLAFGHGKHACPGRFIVAYVLKAMMTHLLVNYDIKMENPGKRPEDAWFSYACIPNRSANVMLRRRISN